MTNNETKQPEQSLTVYEDIGGIARKPERKIQMHSDGSGTEVSAAPGPTQLKNQEVQDILWKLSTIKPWQIAPEDRKAVKDALSVLAWATIPATTEQAAFWISRLLAHFPRRDVAVDSVVVSDLSADMIDAGVALVALANVCDDIRKEATLKNPWLPPSGEILKRAIERTKRFETYQRQLRSPRLAPPKPKEEVPAPWAGKTWDELADDIRVQFWRWIEPYNPHLREMCCRVAGFHAATVINWGEELNNQSVEGV
jgi:hypothetical protein